MFVEKREFGERVCELGIIGGNGGTSKTSSEVFCAHTGGSGVGNGVEYG